MFWCGWRDALHSAQSGLDAAFFRYDYEYTVEMIVTDKASALL